jgi:hypothetical protein
MAQLYAKDETGGRKALVCTNDGLLKVDTEFTATIDPTGLATSAKQDTTNTNLSTISTKLTKKVQLHANIDFSSSSAQTIIAAPGSGNRIRLCQLMLMSGATTPVNSEIAIKSGSTTIKTVRGMAMVLDFPEHCNLGTNEALVLQATTADRIVGGVDYYVEAV